MKWLITGGVGFIGTNLASHLVEVGADVVLLDDLSRQGVTQNADFLRRSYNLKPHVVDISEQADLRTFFTVQGEFDVIAHLAGQVSLLESISNPRRDFEVNALGTLNILEYLRAESPTTTLIAMSSNKVYGDLSHINFTEGETRFVADDYPKGFNETLPLDFGGPYGCSKGAADQYVADYARIFGLTTVSLRQSSVYGLHQHPRSDQGWVAHLMNEALQGHAIQLNGVGKQVRDLLWAPDLCALFVALAENAVPGAGHQFNVGGGPANSMSILEFFSWIEQNTKVPVRYRTGPTRPSDQRVFISDNSSVTSLTGWRPSTAVGVGLERILTAINA